MMNDIQHVDLLRHHLSISQAYMCMDYKIGIL